jgi:hypothetical protein
MEESTMPITLVPFAAEHVDATGGLVSPQEAALIAAHPDVLLYRAVYDGPTCVGVIALKLVSEYPEIIVSTAVGQRQKGYATAAVKEMVRYAFEDLAIPAVYAKCLAGRPSNRVVEKNGFAFVTQQGPERFYELGRPHWLAAQQAATQQAAPTAPAEQADEEGPAENHIVT